MSDFRTGNGADWLDLLATLVGRYRPQQVEMLVEPGALAAWLDERGLRPGAPVTADDLEAGRALREALHRAAVATVGGGELAEADRDLLRAALADDEPVRLLPNGPGLRAAPPSTATAALARLAHQAVTDLTGPTRARLHACGDETCAGLFLDHTGRRRWCSDERCGVRARVRAHRARAREGG